MQVAAEATKIMKIDKGNLVEPCNSESLHLDYQDGKWQKELSHSSKDSVQH